MNRTSFIFEVLSLMIYHCHHRKKLMCFHSMLGVINVTRISCKTFPPLSISVEPHRRLDN